MQKGRRRELTPKGWVGSVLPEMQLLPSIGPIVVWLRAWSSGCYSKTVSHCVTEPECQPPPMPEDPYLKRIRDLNDDRQQVEASNRWRLLQSQTPLHDVGALRRKVNYTR